MQDIKAIETRYKGYRFRSRLEARWAVFFDALGVDWEYETQGFDLSDTPDLYGYPLRRYLPDFWLPDLKMWFEIKPCLPSNSFLYTEEESLMRALVDLTGAKEGYVFWGLPDEMTPGSECSPNQYPWRRLYQFDCIPWSPLEVFNRTRDAIDAAKSARFEFGENGASARV